MNKRALLGFALLSLMISSVHAAEEAAKKSTSPWGGEAEVGILITRGNTETNTQNIKLGVHYKVDPWLHQLSLESLRTEDRGVVSADRFGAYYRSTYKISEPDYAYGSLRYEDDPFAGFDKRTTEVIGYGRKLFNEKAFLWDVEAGVGGRQTDRTDNTSTSEAIVRLATLLQWNISETSALKEELSVASGSENTLTESITSLKVKINSALAMKLRFKVTDNSDVPVGKKNTDTETAVTLVYDFN